MNIRDAIRQAVGVLALGETEEAALDTVPEPIRADLAPLVALAAAIVEALKPVEAEAAPDPEPAHKKGKE